VPKNQLMPGLQKPHVNMTYVPETALLLVKPRVHHRGLLPSHATTLVRSRETVVFLSLLVRTNPGCTPTESHRCEASLEDSICPSL
ncbi:hypothetical protein FIBSPDRAFT_862949, partial [Athelia psychrophila]